MAWLWWRGYIPPEAFIFSTIATIVLIMFTIQCNVDGTGGTGCVQERQEHRDVVQTVMLGFVEAADEWQGEQSRRRQARLFLQLTERRLPRSFTRSDLPPDHAIVPGVGSVGCSPQQ